MHKTALSAAYSRCVHEKFVSYSGNLISLTRKQNIAFPVQVINAATLFCCLRTAAMSFDCFVVRANSLSAEF